MEADKYIREGKKIRRCEANIAKMNIWLYMWLSLTQWGEVRWWAKKSAIQLGESLKELFTSLADFMMIMSLPVVFPFVAHLSIKQAKKKTNKSTRR